MPIDDYSLDKPDTAVNAATAPGKYIKIAVPDFSDVASNTNPATMAPTPLTSYLRLGAVEDVTKAGKATGTVGLITDMSGYPLVTDLNAPYNPSYDPYAPFGGNNLPVDGSPPLPPATTPTSVVGAPPSNAAAYPTAAGPDPSGEDLASLVQGFADDTRNRGRPRMRPRSATGAVPYTVGGQPNDQGSTAQGPLYGYPWVTPVTGAKAPGQLDAGVPPVGTGTTAEDLRYTASSKPLFFPDDYRTLESSQLHTKGGWRDHTDGNRITTTRGDKVEVIRGNYKLIVLGRQDQTKPKYAGMDLSGGQSDTGGGDLTADASSDFFQGSTAFSSLFEWRQASTHALFQETVDAVVPPDLLAKEAADQQAAADAVAALNKLTLDTQTLVDPKGVLVSTINAAQKMVLNADNTLDAAFASSALSAAKKALLTAEQAAEPNLLQAWALAVLAITVTPGTADGDAAAAKTAATTAQTTAWNATGVDEAIAAAKTADGQVVDWKTALAAWRLWTATPASDADANALAQKTADSANLATNAATLAAAAVAAAAALAAAIAQATSVDPAFIEATNDATAAAQAATDATNAATEAGLAAMANPGDQGLQQAWQDAQAKATQATQDSITAATAAANAAKSAPDPALADAYNKAVTAAAKAAAAAAKAEQDAVDAAAALKTTTGALAAAVKNAASAWTAAITGVTKQAANVLLSAQLSAQLAQSSPPGQTATDAAAAALAAAALSTAQVKAAKYEVGYFTSPLETLQLWEDADGAPADFRSFSTTKKGSGPKVQVKYQRDPNDLYTQDGKKTPGVPGDGVTYATPISLGVSINETWSYQIYNYSGIGYYPATQPQPWEPAPPKTQTQPIGGAALSGVGLPADAPTRDPAAMVDWSPVPRWVIYPVAKIVNKSYVVHQSSEVFAERTVSVTAGPRPPDDDNPEPSKPVKTYAPDVPAWLDAGGNSNTAYNDTLGNTRNLPAQATYDRDLISADTEFPSDDTLASWILDFDGNPLNIREYNKIDQTWAETHVKKQVTILRADTTLGDTVVTGTQNTKLHAGASTSNTKIDGQQHTQLHAGSTLSDTTIDGKQHTILHAASTLAETTVDWAVSTSHFGTQSTTTNAKTLHNVKTSESTTDVSATLMSVALKAAIMDFQLTAAAIHVGMNLGFTVDIAVLPHFSIKELQFGLKGTDLDITDKLHTTISTIINLM